MLGDRGVCPIYIVIIVLPVLAWRFFYFYFLFFIFYVSLVRHLHSLKGIRLFQSYSSATLCPENDPSVDMAMFVPKLEQINPVWTDATTINN